MFLTPTSIVDTTSLMGNLRLFIRTGVRAAVDWLFIRVQNSRRYAHIVFAVEDILIEIRDTNTGGTT